MPFGGHYRHKMEEIGGHFEIHGILEDIMEIWEDIPVFPNLTRPKSKRPSEKNNFLLKGGMCIKLFTVRGGIEI